MRYFLEITYKGTHYHGWQIQPNAVTVQETIEKALATILQSTMVLTGSGRTDTGVHAAQQWAHVDLKPGIDLDQLQYRLNALLPHDIVVRAIYAVQPAAHARFDALARTYAYRIMPDKDPFLRETHYWFAKPLDLGAMNQAAAILSQKTDFTSMSKLSTTANHCRCSVFYAQWDALSDGRLTFTIQANRFLRGMVRSIVGNLLQVGLHQLSVEAFESLIDQKDRNLGASLAPACGLTLTAVAYPAELFIQ